MTRSKLKNSVPCLLFYDEMCEQAVIRKLFQLIFRYLIRVYEIFTEIIDFHGILNVTL